MAAKRFCVFRGHEKEDMGTPRLRGRSASEGSSARRSFMGNGRRSADAGASLEDLFWAARRRWPCGASRAASGLANVGPKKDSREPPPRLATRVGLCGRGALRPISLEARLTPQGGGRVLGAWCGGRGAPLVPSGGMGRAEAGRDDRLPWGRAVQPLGTRNAPKNRAAIRREHSPKANPKGAQACALSWGG